jgi:hypothetical protein
MFTTLNGTKFNFDFYGVFGNFSGPANYSVYLGARDPTGNIFLAGVKRRADAQTQRRSNIRWAVASLD